MRAMRGEVEGEAQAGRGDNHSGEGGQRSSSREEGAALLARTLSHAWENIGVRAPWWRGWGRRRIKEYRNMRHRDCRMDWGLLPLSLMKLAQQPLMGGGSVNAGDVHACARIPSAWNTHGGRCLSFRSLNFAGLAMQASCY